MSAFSSVEKTLSEIRELKKEKEAVILAHNYQPPEIYEVADVIGDSLELALSAQKTRQKEIIFCGVDFMADTAKILNPDVRVFHPTPDARCSMAHMVSPAEISRLKAMYPDAEVVSYVNTSTAVKAVSDICCTSSNAVEIVNGCDTDQVIFLPDSNLAAWCQRFSDKEIIPGKGFCYVHDAVTPESVRAMKSLHPGAPFLAHPECSPEVIDMADAVCSTSGMIKFCRDNENAQFIIGTESGMLNRLRRDIPEKKFFSVAGICSPMKLMTLEKVKTSLESGFGEVLLEEDLMTAARKPLERMIALSKTMKASPCRSGSA